MDWLARWQSWLDPDKKPAGWERNLWGEFFALHHRRNRWHGFQRAHDASPNDAKQLARWLRQWVLRNHIETQAVAIRRLADRSSHRDTVALGRLLDEITAHPTELLESGVALEATRDADDLQEEAQRVTTFATKVVAHLDSDHASASQETHFDDFDRALDVASHLWQTWFPRANRRGRAR